MKESSSPQYIRWAVGAALWLLSLLAVFLFSRGEDKKEPEEPLVEKPKGEIVSFKIGKYDSNLKAWSFELKTKNASFDDVEFEFEEGSLFYIDITTDAVIKLKDGAELEDNFSYPIKVKLKGNSEVFKEGKIRRLKKTLNDTHIEDSIRTEENNENSITKSSVKGVDVLYKERIDSTEIKK